MVQLKVLFTEAVRIVFQLSPLQIAAVDALVTKGFGSTLIIIVLLEPVQVPLDAMGVTMYSIVPVVEFDGLLSVWMMLEPEPGVAPVIPPVMVPMLQLNDEGMLAERFTDVEVPLQMV